MQKIRVAGIVAEYNPFHRGHAWMIHQLRKAGCEVVVCAMSGAFAQRAEPALFPPGLRAKAAVAAGADLVLRLPLPWAVSSAERFAEGGTGLLAALGCVDTLAFGAETADIEALQTVAELFRAPEFRIELKKQLASGMSFAAARAAAVEVVDPRDAPLLATPNNILGVEYCKALNGPVFEQVAYKWIYRESPEQAKAFLRQKRELEARGGTLVDFLSGSPAGAGLVYPRPFAIERRGTGHDADTPGEDGFASASLLRRMLYSGGDATALAEYVPPECLPLYTEAVARGEVLSPDRWQLAMLARLRGQPPERLANCASAGEGLEERLAKAAARAVTLEQLYAGMKSKRFAHSRVRRLALEAALALPRDLPVLPPFAHVLAANEKGLGLLKIAKDTAVVPVSTSLARLRKTGGEAAKLIELESAAEDLYDLCLCAPRAGGASFTQPAAIVKEEKQPF